MTRYNYGVRTTAGPDAWVQTGFTQEEAEAAAEKLNAMGFVFAPRTEPTLYVAARLN